MNKSLDSNYVKRTQKGYSLSFKLEVVREVESGELSANGAKKKYGIQEDRTVVSWLKKNGNLDRELQIKFTMERSPEQRIIELEAKNRLLEKQKASLEKQLKFQQDKAIMFDIMVDIGEKEFNIPIRKKSVPEALINLKRRNLKP